MQRHRQPRARRGGAGVEQHRQLHRSIERRLLEGAVRRDGDHALTEPRAPGAGGERHVGRVRHQEGAPAALWHHAVLRAEGAGEAARELPGLARRVGRGVRIDHMLAIRGLDQVRDHMGLGLRGHEQGEGAHGLVDVDEHLGAGAVGHGHKAKLEHLDALRRVDGHERRRRIVGRRLRAVLEAHAVGRCRIRRRRWAGSADHGEQSRGRAHVSGYRSAAMCLG
ncbi:MAG: hypothetical protein A2138_01310 [Deltaproteobacteria bacterium RBG_16_71_12]|nr:MAG: hypothetical protein A2138_01310 [Deltaproteobacteria bacterium RBG_16_71_12]